jgi:antitoxin HigA-1
MPKLWITKTTIEVGRMMKMYDPPHPGEIIKGLWLDPLGASITEAAHAMGISRKTLSKIVNGHGRVTPEIALRLSITLGSSPESWLGHQAAYDLWQMAQHGTSVQAVPLLQPAQGHN